MDLEAVKRIGVAAAYKGADVLLSRFGRIESIREKGRNDLVTDADTGAERIIIETIRRAFPDHGFLAEESGSQEPRLEDFCWIIDPLDGTTNYAHRLGIFSISLAFARKGEVLLGIVLDPLRGELFTAVSGGGARLNGRPIRVSEASQVAESLLVTGFPYNIQAVAEPVLNRFSNCLNAAQGMRRLGSAALDLCYVACGRFEGFWESYLKPWDTAAGVCILEAAGGRVTDFADQPYDGRRSLHLLATNGRIHQEMVSLLSKEEIE
ncbi:MAG: inositol monophosphatase family protein [Desulfobacterales bacterium]|jgi:myo-inositol-1(or 4)-monophosphatase